MTPFNLKRCTPKKQVKWKYFTVRLPGYENINYQLAKQDHVLILEGRHQPTKNIRGTAATAENQEGTERHEGTQRTHHEQQARRTGLLLLSRGCYCCCESLCPPLHTIRVWCGGKFGASVYKGDQRMTHPCQKPGPIFRAAALLVVGSSKLGHIPHAAATRFVSNIPSLLPSINIKPCPEQDQKKGIPIRRLL